MEVSLIAGLVLFGLDNRARMLEDMDRACNRIKRALPRCRIFYDQPPPADEQGTNVGET